MEKEKKVKENIYTALMKAQEGFQTPRLNKQGFNYKYADLAECKKAVESSLHENDLVLHQPLVPDENGNIIVKTVLTHTITGESLESSLIIKASNLDKPKDIQNIGGNITYFRRYTLCSLLNIFGEEDKDGATVEKKNLQSKPTQAIKIALTSRDKLEYLLDSHEEEGYKRSFLTSLKIESLDQLSDKRVEFFLNKFRKIASKRKKIVAINTN